MTKKSPLLDLLERLELFGERLESLEISGDLVKMNDPEANALRIIERLRFLAARCERVLELARVEVSQRHELAGGDSVRVMCMNNGLSEPAIEDAVRLFYSHPLPMPGTDAVLFDYNVCFRDLHTPAARVLAYDLIKA